MTADEELRSTLEALETTNRELHSTGEELEATSAALRSSNQELEAMSEQLRSMNEELEAIRDGLSVVVLDGDGRVESWTTGVRPKQAQGVVERLREPIRAAERGAQKAVELELRGPARGGRPAACRVSVLPLRAPNGPIRGTVLLIWPRRQRAEGP